jgi:hypothetical protein
MPCNSGNCKAYFVSWSFQSQCMKQLYFLIFVCTIISLSAQTQPEIFWEKKIGGSKTEKAYDFLQDFEGNIVMVGETNTDISDEMGISSDFFILKTNANGEVIWEKKYGGTGLDVVYSIVGTQDGGYLIAGMSNSHNNDFIENYGSGDGRILKLDVNGNLEWTKNYGGSSQDVIKSIISNGDGTYTMAGSTSSSDYDLTENNGIWDFWVFQINAMGEIIWSKNFGGSQSDFAEEVIATQDGGFLVGGYTDSQDFDVLHNFGETDYWVVKIDNSGNLEWSKNYGGSKIDELLGLTETNSGDFGLIGYSESSDGLVSNNYGDLDVWLVKIDSLGNLIWERNYGGSGAEEGHAITSLDNQFFITGMSSDVDQDVTESFGWVDLWMFKVNSEGELIWQKSMGGPWADYGKSILMDEDGNGMIAGHYEFDNPTGEYEDINMDFWLIYFADGEMGTYDQANTEISIYPNPTQNLLFFSEELNQIDIYTSLGQKVKTFEKGTHINLSNIPKGTYFLKAKSATGKSIHQKFLKN